MEQQRIIWTIGHSTRTFETFAGLLQSSGIEVVADIRLYPGSRRFPHFDKENLEVLLKEKGIGYLHLRELGGRRRPRKDSPNTAWKNPSFRGYADYMETEAFRIAIETLQQLAQTKRVAYMCSEATWWNCHRSLVSDYLKWKGWEVRHIMDGKEILHPYTSPARIVDGKLTYSDDSLLFPE
jgi:uncharacterized protein (DUF488 family)